MFNKLLHVMTGILFFGINTVLWQLSFFNTTKWKVLEFRVNLKSSVEEKVQDFWTLKDILMFCQAFGITVMVHE